MLIYHMHLAYLHGWKGGDTHCSPHTLLCYVADIACSTGYPLREQCQRRDTQTASLARRYIATHAHTIACACQQETCA